MNIILKNFLKLQPFHYIISYYFIFKFQHRPNNKLFLYSRYGTPEGNLPVYYFKENYKRLSIRFDMEWINFNYNSEGFFLPIRESKEHIKNIVLLIFFHLPDLKIYVYIILIKSKNKKKKNASFTHFILRKLEIFQLF